METIVSEYQFEKRDSDGIIVDAWGMIVPGRQPRYGVGFSVVSVEDDPAPPPCPGLHVYNAGASKRYTDAAAPEADAHKDWTAEREVARELGKFALAGALAAFHQVTGSAPTGPQIQQIKDKVKAYLKALL
jgi:hypothetical protein